MKYSVNKNIVKIESNGLFKYVELFQSDTVRIYAEKNAEDLVEMSHPAPLNFFDINLYEDSNNPEIKIEYDQLSIRINAKLNVSIYKKGMAFFKEVSSSDNTLSTNLTISDDSRVFGLGDKMSTLDKKGYFYSSWNTDTSEHHDELFPSLYKSSNFLLNYSFKNYYGIYFNSTYRYNFDIAKTDLNLIGVTSLKAKLDYYLFLSDEVSSIVSNFSSMCGHPYLVRLKTLGNNQSRWSYENEEQVLEVADKFEKYNIPLDYIHLDIHYLDSYKILTIDKNRFPQMKNLADKLSSRGVELIAINDAAVKIEKGYPLYDELIDNKLVSTLDGQTYVNAVWPGDSVFPNYFDVKTQEVVYKYMAKFIEENGFSGIWNDMNEPASFKGELPLDVDMSFSSRSLKHEESHNLYGEKMSKCSYQYFMDHKRRPYVFSRAGFATTSKYAFFWNGDNFSLWNHLRYSIPQSLSMGLSNFMFNGDDVGGFGGDCNKQLLIRWVEANILFPFFRNHSSLYTKHQEPYCFDEETLIIYKKYIDLRYQFLPYLYDCCYQMALNGNPVTRPLFFNYQDDLKALDVNDEYMVGESILVAPVLNKDSNSRIVYFPAGKWIDYFTSEAYEGGKEYIVNLNIDQLGLYIKDNSIVPMYQNLMHINKKNIDTLTLRIFGDSASTEIYEDDGDTTDYLDDKYNIYRVKYLKGVLTFETIHKAYKSDYKKVKIVLNEGNYEIPFAYQWTLDMKKCK